MRTMISSPFERSPAMRLAAINLGFILLAV